MNTKIRLKKMIIISCIGLCLSGLISGCTYHVRGPLPPAMVEVRPACPHKRARWVPGHWKWRRGKHVWIPGHWRGR